LNKKSSGIETIGSKSMNFRVESLNPPKCDHLAVGIMSKREGIMRKSELSEGQIIGTLKQQGSGILLPILWNRRIDCFKWKSKYGGLEISGVRRLKQLEAEYANTSHTQRVACGALCAACVVGVSKRL
jgi:putative transposase